LAGRPFQGHGRHVHRGDGPAARRQPDGVGSLAAACVQRLAGGQAGRLGDELRVGLSRLESGQRRPTLELLLPLARAHGVPIDDLVGAAPVGDPRVHMRPVSRPDMTLIPLSRRAGGVQAYKLIIPSRRAVPEPQTHEGYEWLYVLDGELRLVLGDQDLVLRPGEAAEFTTQIPHWFGSAGDRPAELLSLFGRQGERAHLRARARRPDR
jgi:quercetin dioxygenase-like cupin family protein